MQQLSKQAAWTIINSRLTEPVERKKVVHRQFGEDEIQEVQRVDTPVVEEQEESTVQRENAPEIESQSDAEKNLRKGFYHETSKKQDVAEEIKKRKERREEQDDSDDIQAALDDAIGIDDDEPVQNTTNPAQQYIDRMNAATSHAENDKAMNDAI